MKQAFKKALGLLVGSDSTSTLSVPKHMHRNSKAPTQRELIQLESEIGSKIFGEIPKGHRREFFNLDPTTWIWYEEWMDQGGKKRQATTRYEIQRDRIMKVQEGAKYSFIEGQEKENLLTAIDLYYEQVMRAIYKVDPRTGQKLA